MDDLEAIRTLVQLIDSSLLTIVSLALLLSERRSHAETNAAYRRDLRRVAKLNTEGEEEAAK